MKIFFESSFGKDLKSIKNKELYRRVENLIAEVKTANELSEIRQLKKMRGYTTFYRIRLGNYRIGIEALGNEIVFVRILHRRDIYKYFP
ncbi:MAG TPA: type II toxin-antitoxin system RelE/ParE family toxin [Anaerolineae bacterium]|nr:type II toxin-antitoxin system RelE/ParE family toxin [Anaerolineae bacterium]